MADPTKPAKAAANPDLLPPEPKPATREAQVQDDSVEGEQQTDEQVEAEAEEQTESQEGETQTETEAEAEEEAETEGEEKEGEEAGEEEIEVPDHFVGKDGKLDPKAVLKSYLELQKQFSSGKRPTAEMEEQLAALKYIREVASADPDVMKSFEKAEQKMKGTGARTFTPAPNQTSDDKLAGLSRDEVVSKCKKLRESGKVEDATELMADWKVANHPEVVAARETRQQFQSRSQQDAEARGRQMWAEHFKGKEPPQEVAAEIHRVYGMGFRGPLSVAENVARENLKGKVVSKATVKLNPKKLVVAGKQPAKASITPSRNPPTKNSNAAFSDAEVAILKKNKGNLNGILG